MKLAWKLVRVGIGASLVGAAVTTYVIVNKKEESNTGAVNTTMYKIPGFSGEAQQKQDTLTQESFATGQAQTKFNELLTNLGFGDTLTNNALTVDKLAEEFKKEGIKVSEPLNKYGTSFRPMTGTFGPYILASFGDKFGDLTKLTDKLKALTAKPTYQEFLALFPEDFKLREKANKIFKYSFRDASREAFGLPPASEAPKAVEPVNAQKVRMANWNLQNYSGTYSSSTAKRTRAMAAIINDAQINILGAEEVDNVKGLFDIAKELNKSQINNPWKVVYSTIAEKASDGKVMGGLGAGEYYGFIYNHNVVQPKPFADGSIGKLYDNPWKTNHMLSGAANDKSAYVRPPFGVQFEHKNAKGEISDFTAVIAHLDSPGHKAKTATPFYNKNHSSTDPTYEGKASEYDSAAGTQETWEAEQVSSVMDFFDKQNGDDSDLVFMGDTNIKYYRDAHTHTSIKKNPFQSLITAGYEELLDPSQNSSATSLSNQATMATDDRVSGRLYVNPYDKIFAKTSQLIPGSQKRYDIASIFSRGVVDANDFYGNEVKNVTKVSDHTLVYADYDMEKADTDINATKSSYPTDHEVDVNSADYFQLVTQAGLTPLQATRILYYRNLVGKIDNAAELDKVISYYDTFWKKIQGTKESQYITRTKFVFNDTPTTSTTEPIRVEGGTHITRIHDLAIAKLDVNAATMADLAKALKDNLLDTNTLNNILKLRAAGTQITSYAQIQDAVNPLPDFYAGVLDYSSASVMAENPFDLNKAGYDYLVSIFTGRDSAFGLSEYHIAALVAKRQQDGPLTEAKLQAAIGSYAFGKLPLGLDFTSTPPAAGTTGYEADLAAQINIAHATKAQLLKYLGANTGFQVFSLIQSYAKTHPIAGQPGKGELVPGWDYIASNIKYSNYFMDQLKQLFKIDDADKVVTIDIPRATYTFKQLQTEAMKVDVTQSSTVVYRSPEFLAFCKWVNDHGGPTPVVDAYGHEKHIGTLTDSIIKETIKAIQNSMSWDSAYGSLSETVRYGRSSHGTHPHKVEYTEAFNWMRPTDSSPIKVGAPVYVPTEHHNTGSTGTGSTGTGSTGTGSTGTTVTDTHHNPAPQPVANPAATASTLPTDQQFTLTTFFSKSLEGFDQFKHWLTSKRLSRTVVGKFSKTTSFKYVQEMAQMAEGAKPTTWAQFADTFYDLRIKHNKGKPYSGDHPGDGHFTGSMSPLEKINEHIDWLV